MVRHAPQTYQVPVPNLIQPYVTGETVAPAVEGLTVITFYGTPVPTMVMRYGRIGSSGPAPPAPSGSADIIYAPLHGRCSANRSVVGSRR